jgi:hypothetical protein
MANTVITGPILDSFGQLANGYLYGEQSVRQEISGALVTSITVKARVKDGVPFLDDGVTPLEAPPTLPGEAMKFIEDFRNYDKQVVRNVIVPENGPVAYAALEEVVKPYGTSSFIVPGSIRALIDTASGVTAAAEQADGAAERAEAAAELAELVDAQTVNSGEIVGDDLVLTRTDGGTIVAGNVRGPRGLPGVNSVSNDEANAELIATKGTATETALAGVLTRSIGEARKPVDNIMRSLDMRDPRELVVLGVGDSTTSPYATGAFERTWKELAASVWPERPARVTRWSKEGNAYNAPVLWQDGAKPATPGGTVPNSVIGSDTFSADNQEMNGRVPDVGANSWTAAAGAYLANQGEMISNPAYTGGGIPAATLPALARTGKDFKFSGQWRIRTIGSSMQRRVRAAAAGALDARIVVLGGATATCSLQVPVGGVLTTVGTFPAGTIPSSTEASWYSFSIELVGNAVTATLNGATLNYTMDPTQVALLGDSFGLQDQSAYSGLRAIDVRGTITEPATPGEPSDLGFLEVYNASVAGSTFDWQLARLVAMTPKQPDLVWINHGINYWALHLSNEDFLARFDAFLEALFTRWEPCPVVISSQNPLFAKSGGTTQAQVDEHEGHMLALRPYARERGMLYLPFYEAMIARTDKGESFMQPDGIHPLIGTGTGLQTTSWKGVIRAQSERP